MEQWHRFTAEETAQKLNTDISLGRTTDRRQGSEKRSETVFLIPRTEARECIKPALTDAAVMIFVITAAVAMLVGALYEAAVAVALLFGACVIAGWLKYASGVRIFGMAEHMLPTTNLISEGNVKDEDCRNLRQGDVIILLSGDVIPADCRLVRSSGLKVIEYFTDPDTAKRRARVVEKNANALYSENEERESYDNMLYAGSTVVSGKCKAIVVATGKDTRASMLDSGIPLVSGDVAPASVASFSGRGRAFSTVMLIAALPITIIGTLCQSAEGLGIVSVFFIAVTLALTSFSEISSSAAEYIVSKTLSETDSGAFIHVASRADAFAEADTLLILCESAVVDTERHVRNVFWNGADKKGDNLSGSMKPLAERMDKLLAAIELVNSQNVFEDIAAFTEYVKTMGISRRWNISEGKKAMPKIDFPITGAFSAVVIDEKTAPVGKEIVSCAPSALLIRSCRQYRASSGEAKPISRSLLVQAVNIYNSYAAMGLSPYVITSTVSATEGTVLEGIVAVGIAIPEHNKNAAAELRALGVRPVFILPDETAKNIYVAQNCGISDDTRDDCGVAIASQLSDDADVSDLVRTCSVFVGFGKKGSAEISKAFAKNGAKAVSVVFDSFDLREVSPFNISVIVDGESHDSARISSSAAVSPSTCDNPASGFGAFREIVLVTRSAGKKLGACFEYFIACIAFRAMFTLLPLVFGVASAVPSAALLLLMGLCGDIAAVAVLGCAERAEGAVSLNKTNKKEDRANRMLCIFCGILIGAAASGGGMILVASGRLTAASYASYALPTIAAVQFAALGIALYRSHCKLPGKPFVLFSAVTAFLCVLPYLLAYFTLPPLVREVASTLLGDVSAHKLVLLCAPISALVTCTMLLFSRKLSENAEKSGLFKD